MAVLVKFHDARVRRVLTKSEPILLRHIIKALDRHGWAFRNEMDKRFTGGANKLQVRTGNLRGTIGHQVISGTKVNGTKLAVFIGSANTPYAAIQEFGGTIRPRRAKKLAIPLDAAKTAAGVPRYASPRVLQADPAFKTFIIKSKKGNLLIVQRKPEGDIVPLYVLVDSVTLKPRLGFSRTFKSKKMRADRVKRLSAALRDAFVEAVNK